MVFKSGIVISGSEWSVYDPTKEAIPLFLERLRNLVRNHEEIKILGICFGCQAIAQAFGGRVGKMKLDNMPMLMNREKITFLNDFNEKYIQKSKKSQIPNTLDCLYLVECHGDNVEVLPDNAVLYAESDKTPVEIFGIKENLLAMQGHPEFNPSFMLDKIFPEGKDNWINYDKLFEESKKSLYEGGIDQKLMSNFCIDFLKNY